MSNTLDKIVTKTRKKAKDAFSEDAPFKKGAEEAGATPLKEDATQSSEPPRSACVTLGVSKEGVIVVGPGKFRKVFATVEEAKAWLKA